MNAPEIRRAARIRFDSWRFWMVIAYVGLAFMMILGAYLFTQQTRDEADRHAAQKVANTAQVTDCLASYRSAPNVLRVLDLLEVLANNSILANESLLKANPTGQQAQIRKDSLERLRPSLPTIQLFRQSTEANRRSLADCKSLATKLDVPIEKLLQQSKEETP